MLTLEEKIGQMLMIGFEGHEPPADLLRWLSEGRIGNVILFARNVSSPNQLAQTTAALHAAARYPVMISIDQEGGTVTRLYERAGFTETPAAMALGAAADPALAEEIAYMMGIEMRAVGINWNLAPCVDLAHDSSNPVIGTRSFGTDKNRVSELAVAQMRGFQRAGVATSIKHFPGHGNTPVDTHVALAVVSGSLDYLWEHDLVPFRACVDAGAATVMVSHVKFEALDAEHPATLSPALSTGLLRDDVGFAGVACTDCLEMKAIADHYGSGESAVLAALAGADVILFSHSFQEDSPLSEEVFNALYEAARSGRLPMSRIDEAVERIQKLKETYPVHGPMAPDSIRSPDHIVLSRKAAQAGLTLLRADDSVFPLPQDTQRVGLVEFTSHQDSAVMENDGLTGFASLLYESLPQCEIVMLPALDPDNGSLSSARRIAMECDILVLATRNAHLIPAQQAIAAELLASAQKSVLVCLRNPYDAEVLPGATAVLCTCGDTMPSLWAASEALLGSFKPSGKLTVPVKVAG